jgi:hypothetical protein
MAMLTAVLIGIGLVVLFGGGARFIHRHSLLSGWW